MTKYTPGPWLARWDGLIGYKAPSSRGRMMFSDIAWTVTPRRDREGNILSYEQQKEIKSANAQLIASTPELIEAAQALLAKLDNMTTDQFSKGGEREERETLRAIIQKATGEPQTEDEAPF